MFTKFLIILCAYVQTYLKLSSGLDCPQIRKHLPSNKQIMDASAQRTKPPFSSKHTCSSKSATNYNNTIFAGNSYSSSQSSENHIVCLEPIGFHSLKPRFRETKELGEIIEIITVNEGLGLWP